MSDRMDVWRNRLSEYLDGELSDSEGRELEEHLASCAGCRAVLDELRRVVAEAAKLVDSPPVEDLWPEIAERIRAEETRAGDRENTVAADGRPRSSLSRKLSFSVPQLAAAAVLLVAVSSTVAWQMAGGLSTGEQPAPDRVAGLPAAGGLLQVARVADLDYESAITQLEEALDAGRQRLDTATVRKVEERLALIDRAIEEARRALATDPANSYLNHYLANTMRRKLDLLRRTAALTEL